MHFHSMRFQESLVQMLLGHGFDNVFENCKWEAKFADPLTPAKGYIQIDNPDVTINHYRFIGCNFTPHSENQPMIYLRQGFAHFDNSSFQAAVGASYGYAIEVDNVSPAPFGTQLHIHGCYFSGCRRPWNVLGDSFIGFDFEVRDTLVIYAESGNVKVPTLGRMYNSTVIVGFEGANTNIIEFADSCDAANNQFRAVPPMSDAGHGKVVVSGQFGKYRGLTYIAPEGFIAGGSGNYFDKIAPLTTTGAFQNTGTFNIVVPPIYHPDGIGSMPFFNGALAPGSGNIDLNLPENEYIVIWNGDIALTTSGDVVASDINSTSYTRVYYLDFYVFSDGSSHAYAWPAGFKVTGVPTPAVGTNMVSFFRWARIPVFGGVFGGYWICLAAKLDIDVT